MGKSMKLPAPADYLTPEAIGIRKGCSGRAIRKAIEAGRLRALRITDTGRVVYAIRWRDAAKLKIRTYTRSASPE